MDNLWTKTVNCLFYCSKQCLVNCNISRLRNGDAESESLTITELKNILKQQSRDELIGLLLDCYKVNPQIKEYISARYASQDTMEQIFKSYKNKVHDVFFLRSMTAQFKIGEARKAVNDFKKICSNEKLVCEENEIMYIV